MEEVIRRFHGHGVRYLLIGGQALRLEGMPRFSMDWDFFVPADDPGNFDRINLALGDVLDVPLVPLGPRGENFVQTYQTPWGVIQFHLKVPGLPLFHDAERRGKQHALEDGTPVRALCGDDLLACKKAAGRPQDRDDADFLEEKRKAGKL
jgi:hypothetical protein